MSPCFYCCFQEDLGPHLSHNATCIHVPFLWKMFAPLASCLPSWSAMHDVCVTCAKKCAVAMGANVLKYTFVFIQIMHLSMLSLGGGGGGGRSVPRVGILIVRHIPSVENLTWPPSWIRKRAWKSILFPRLFPAQVVREKPWKRGCLKITPPS